MVGAVLAELLQELLALVLQRVDAALEIDHQPALVRQRQVLLLRRNHLDRLRDGVVQVAQVGEVGQIGQLGFLQHRPVDAIDRLDAERGVLDVVAGGHDHLVLRLVPHLLLRFHVDRARTLRKINFIST
uniref:Secreted protein n=1 Tax=Anopheles quadriannulatus TaxID=34691 RepID=A0A182XTB1_ANOQN